MENNPLPNGDYILGFLPNTKMTIRNIKRFYSEDEALVQTEGNYCYVSGNELSEAKFMATWNLNEGMEISITKSQEKKLKKNIEQAKKRLAQKQNSNTNL